MEEIVGRILNHGGSYSSGAVGREISRAGGHQGLLRQPGMRCQIFDCRLQNWDGKSVLPGVWVSRGIIAPAVPPELARSARNLRSLCMPPG